MAEPTSPGAALPAWCPAWAERLGDAYLSGTSCMFLLHGNVRDLMPLVPPEVEAQPEEGWGTLPDFLSAADFLPPSSSVSPSIRFDIFSSAIRFFFRRSVNLKRQSRV